MYGIFFISIFIIFYILAFKYLTKTIALLFIIPSGFVFYAINSYHIIFDHKILRSVLETNKNELISYISIRELFNLFVILVIPSFFILITEISYPSFRSFLIKKISYSSICLLIVFLLFFSSSRMIFFAFNTETENKSLTHAEHRIIPLNYITAIVKILKESFISQNSHVFVQISKNAQIGETIRNSNKRTMILFVLGETARADSFSLNQYKRDTNPYLQKKPVISFTEFYSFDTLTAYSVPFIFSPLNEKQFTLAKNNKTENLLDLMKTIGFDVTWYDNNAGSYNIAGRVTEKPLYQSKSCAKTICKDSILIDNLPTKEELSYDFQNRFIVLHQRGSHGPKYFDIYPKKFRIFIPDCQSVSLQACSKESIINAYDNTILYTDFILNKAIEYLEEISDKYNTALIYVSDHGESTGEYNIYLHGTPKRIAPKNQLHVPFIVWFSTDFQNMQKINMDCLTKIKNNHYSHENIFHSVVGLLDINTAVYNPNLDLFKSCRTTGTLTR